MGALVCTQNPEVGVYFFKRALSLEKQASGNMSIEKFIGEYAEAIVYLDGPGEIEHIYLRAYKDRDIGDELHYLKSAGLWISRFLTQELPEQVPRSE